MKRISKLVLLLAVVFSFAVSCTLSKKEKREKIMIKSSNIISKKIGVEGMTCVGCEVTLETSLSKIKGIVKVKASASKNEAIVQFDKTKTDEFEIIKSIKNAGYKITKQ